jgi:hypothetical protein
VTGSANAPEDLINILVRHRIQESGVERQQPRLTGITTGEVPLLAACTCPNRPQVHSYTWFMRFECGCRRRWKYRHGQGWTRAA